MKTREQARAASLTLRPFIGPAQTAALSELCRGEERQFFFEKLCDLAALIQAMPKTYEQEGKGDQAVVSLHYFTGGADWWITEKDIDSDGEGQQQAFGLADLFGDGGELGYISIAEILENRGELDLYWKPITLAEVRANRETLRENYDENTARQNQSVAPAPCVYTTGRRRAPQRASQIA